jgi:hypothetical protein
MSYSFRLSAVVFSTASLTLLPTSSRCEFFQWTNSEIQFLHGSNFQEPGNQENVAQSVITVTHADGWTYGRNFFFMDTLFTEDGQPSQINLYGEVYSTFSLSKISQQDL